MTLRYYQENALNSIWDYFVAHTGNPLAVLPTGSGKSHVLAEFIRRVMDYPNQHILLMSHVKEIIEQDVSKIWTIWPEAPLGIYSAGLGKKMVGRPVTAGSIQSMFKQPHLFGYQSMVIIDEAHLVPKKDEGMYRTFIAELKKYNPKLKIVGLTATPYRLTSGLLTEGKGRIFTDICYEISISELVEKKYLSPLISKPGGVQADLSNVRKNSGGDYVLKEASKAMEADDLTAKAIKETFKVAPDRKSFLFFCVDVAHAQHAAEIIKELGRSVACVTGNTPKAERERILNSFKRGEYQCVTNCNVLTTGFDHPEIDCLVLLRPTESVGLYVQMVGRGSRIAPGKENCLVLDFARNIERHGPVDAVRVVRGGGSKKGGGEGAPVKFCPACNADVLIAVRVCNACGYEWPEREIQIDEKPSDAPIMSKDIEPELWEVTKVSYERHEKPGKPDSMRVTYDSGFMRQVSEWVCLEHKGFAKQKAVQWWLRRNPGSYPATITQALDEAETLRVPTHVQVKWVGKYPEISGYKFDNGEGLDEDIEIDVYDSKRGDERYEIIDEEVPGIKSGFEADDIPF